MIIEKITRPTLLLDVHRCRANIRRMAEKVRSQNIRFRPHFKTHQSREIGRWFRDEGIDSITVSSVGMARYFAMDGWKDITIAFPVNILEIEEIKNLMTSGVTLGLLAEDKDTIALLGKNIRNDFSIWVKIDVGTHRTGLDPRQTDIIDQILECLGQYPQIRFAGFLAHAGHTYQSRSVPEVNTIYHASLEMMSSLRRRYATAFPELKISLGDTPGASMVVAFSQVDELRPGNFVFYDLMQWEIGACQPEDIAVAMACPVVAVHPERKQWIIYGGAIHFAKDFTALDGNRRCFGRMVEYQGNTWSASNLTENPMIISLSQEHGIVQCDEVSFKKCKPGDISLWLPVHSCLTADAMGAYMTTDRMEIEHYRKHVYS